LCANGAVRAAPAFFGWRRKERRRAGGGRTRIDAPEKLRPHVTIERFETWCFGVGVTDDAAQGKTDEHSSTGPPRILGSCSSLLSGHALGRGTARCRARGATFCVRKFAVICGMREEIMIRVEMACQSVTRWYDMGCVGGTIGGGGLPVGKLGFSRLSAGAETERPPPSPPPPYCCQYPCPCCTLPPSLPSRLLLGAGGPHLQTVLQPRVGHPAAGANPQRGRWTPLGKEKLQGGVSVEAASINKDVKIKLKLLL
jgi:hypothetical protein